MWNTYLCFSSVPITTNVVIFLLDLYTSTHSAAPNVLRCQSLIRALSLAKEWSRAQVLEALCCKNTSAWFSEEFKIQVLEKCAEKPEFLNARMPRAWSLCEAHATSWKHSFETLKLWASTPAYSPASPPFEKRILVSLRFYIDFESPKFWTFKSWEYWIT